MKRSLTNLDKDTFWHSGYMWWLILDHHVTYFLAKDLKLSPTILSDGTTLVYMRLPSMTKRYGNGHSFAKHFVYPYLMILVGMHLP